MSLTATNNIAAPETGNRGFQNQDFLQVSGSKKIDAYTDQERLASRKSLDSIRQASR